MLGVAKYHQKSFSFKWRDIFGYLSIGIGVIFLAAEKNKGLKHKYLDSCPNWNKSRGKATTFSKESEKPEKGSD
jgi:hypothetical protein